MLSLSYIAYLARLPSLASTSDVLQPPLQALINPVISLCLSPKPSPSQPAHPINPHQRPPPRYTGKQPNHIARTEGYALAECLRDLLDAAARLLRPGGRLVYFLPTAPELYR